VAPTGGGERRLGVVDLGLGQYVAPLLRPLVPGVAVHVDATGMGEVAAEVAADGGRRRPQQAEGNPDGCRRPRRASHESPKKAVATALGAGGELLARQEEL